jgi:hypothetical protein
MKRVDHCPVCQNNKISNMVEINGNGNKERVLSPYPIPERVSYAKCDHCNAFEVGQRLGESGTIHRIGLFVVTASGEIHLSEDAVKKIIEETRGLIADYRYKGYLDKVAENPYDNAIGAIMLDQIEEEGQENEFKQKYPRSYDALVRRRLKVQGKWDTRSPSPIL